MLSSNLQSWASDIWGRKYQNNAIYSDIQILKTRSSNFQVLKIPQISPVFRKIRGELQKWWINPVSTGSKVLVMDDRTSPNDVWRTKDWRSAKINHKFCPSFPFWPVLFPPPTSASGTHIVLLDPEKHSCDYFRQEYGILWQKISLFLISAMLKRCSKP